MIAQHRLLALALSAPLVLSARPLLAQKPDTFRLKEIVVSAAKVPLPRAATTVVVTVLSGDSLRQRGLHTVADALRQTPSAALAQNGSMGALTSLFLRGGESDYVQVLVDGVRVNNPGGVFDYSNLTLDNVERIEIVRGPVSVLYGSDAVTGVVQIFTRQVGQRQLRARLGGGTGARIVPDSLSGSHYANTAFSAELGGRTRLLAYSAGLGHTGSSGLYAFNNDYGNTTASVRTALTVASSELAWTGRYVRSAYHYPTNGNGQLVDRNQFRRTEAFTTGLDWTTQAARKLQLGVHAGLNHNYERYIDDPDSPADTLGTFTSNSRGRVRRSFVEASGHFRPVETALFSLGVELEEQEDRNRYASDGEFGPFSSAFGKERTNRAAYSQAVYTLGRLALNGGLRVDSNDRFGDFVTYRAGAALRPWSLTRLRVAGGSAFKEPTFFENYAEGFTNGNPELNPEHTRTVEFGLEQLLPRGLGSVQVTHFRQHFRDLIQYVSRPFGSTEPNYENVTSARADGAEFEWSLKPNAALSVDGSFTLLKTEALEAGVEDPAFELGKALLRRPERMATLAAIYARGDLSLETRWYYVGERADLDFSSFPSTRVRLAAYDKLDLSVALRTRALGSNPLVITARLENLLNERYDEILNFPARGRSVWLGVESSVPW